MWKGNLMWPSRLSLSAKSHRKMHPASIFAKQLCCAVALRTAVRQSSPAWRMLTHTCLTRPLLGSLRGLRSAQRLAAQRSSGNRPPRAWVSSTAGAGAKVHRGSGQHLLHSCQRSNSTRSFSRTCLGQVGLSAGQRTCLVHTACRPSFAATHQPVRLITDSIWSPAGQCLSWRGGVV